MALADELRSADVETLRQAVASLPQAQKDMIRAAAVSSATGGAVNWIWIIVISAFSLALLGSVAVLGLSVFKAPAADGAEAQVMLAVFTGVVGFLAGLFTSNPNETGAGKS